MENPTLRHLARQAAVQILYGMDGPEAADSVSSRVEWHGQHFGMPREQTYFVEKLVTGVKEHEVPIDAVLQSTLEGWRLSRLGQMERAILRVGAFELLHCQEIPRAVAINEALDLAHDFCEPESVPLIHGVLDKLKLN